MMRNGASGHSDPSSVSRVAIASLAIGVVGLLTAFAIIGGLLGVVAILVGRAALSRISGSEPMRGAHTIAQAGIVFGKASIIFVPILAGCLWIAMTMANVGGKTEQRVCRAYVNGVGRALRLYASENDGQFPFQLGELVLDDSIDAKRLKCPSSHLRVPEFQNKQEMAEWADTNGDYVYVRPSNEADRDPNSVLVYERLGNHEVFWDKRIDGIYICMTDGYAQWYNRKGGEQFLREHGIEPEYAAKRWMTPAHLRGVFLWLMLPPLLIVLVFFTGSSSLVGRSRRVYLGVLLSGLSVLGLWALAFGIRSEYPHVPFVAALLLIGASMYVGILFGRAYWRDRDERT